MPSCSAFPFLGVIIGYLCSPIFFGFPLFLGSFAGTDLCGGKLDMGGTSIEGCSEMKDFTEISGLNEHEALMQNACASMERRRKGVGSCAPHKR